MILDAKSRTFLHAFLSAHRYGVVSSVAVDGSPQSALVGVAVTTDLEIVFDTVTSSRKYANLVARPSCSFSIGWVGEQTVQLDGIARRPVGEELAQYQDAYFAVWPDGRARLAWPELVHFVVEPRWIRYSDYEQSPPRIDEFTVHL
jgi:pyridoxine/pyridoxamine 5'-phosphate oxidase